MAQNNQPDSSGIDQCGNDGDGEPAAEGREVAGHESGLTRDHIQSEVRRVMRDPWQRILTDYVGTAPSLKALQKFADKAPDRWIQGAVMLAQLAGYTKEINVNHGGVVEHVHVMSDADIQRRLNETRQKLAQRSQMSSLPLPSVSRGTNASGIPAANPVSPHSQVSPTERQHDDVEDVPYRDVGATK